MGAVAEGRGARETQFVPSETVSRETYEPSEARESRNDEREQVGLKKTQTDTVVKVFTTRVDTIFGATFLVLAPEHPLLEQLVNDHTRERVIAYCQTAIKKSEIERQENKEKTGVFTGSYAKNPLTGDKMPIWVADYVLAGYYSDRKSVV